jgi:hypothetical protein
MFNTYSTIRERMCGVYGHADLRFEAGADTVADDSSDGDARAYCRWGVIGDGHAGADERSGYDDNSLWICRHEGDAGAAELDQPDARAAGECAGDACPVKATGWKCL